MCFAPQRRALFRHLNFQKWFEHYVFCTFWIENVLRATTRALFSHLHFQKRSDVGVFCTLTTTACIFLTSAFPKVVRTWCALYNFWLGNVLRATTACNFACLIWPHGSAPAALASLLFDPPEPQIIGKKHSESRLSYLFVHLRLLSSLSFSSLIFSLLLFSSLTLPTSAFQSVQIVGSLTNFLRLLGTQPWIQATLTQPLQCDLQRLSCKHIRTTCNDVRNCSSKTARSRRRSKKKNDFEALFQ